MVKKWRGLEIARCIHQVLDVAATVLGKRNDALYPIRFVQVGLESFNFAKRRQFALCRLQLSQ